MVNTLDVCTVKALYYAPWSTVLTKGPPMIVLALVYVFAVGLVLRHLDRRMRAAQRRREAAFFQRSTGLLV
jgi:hypothetical protein